MNKRLFSLLLVLCMVLTMMPVAFAAGTATEVATYDELVAALGKGNDVVLIGNIVAPDKATLTISSQTLDLGGHSLTLNGESGKLANGTIKNGTIEITTYEGDTVADGMFDVEGTKSYVDGVTFHSDQFALYAIFDLKAGDLEMTGCTIDMASNTVGGNGGLFFTNGGGTLTMTGCTVTGTDIGDFIANGTAVLTGCNITLTGTVANGLDNGINGTALTLNDTTLSVDGATGRGITTDGDNIAINGTSNVTLTNCAEGGIRYKASATITVADTASVSGTVKVDAAATAAKINDTVIPVTGEALPAVAVANDAVSVSVENAVAEVNGVQYADLQTAIGAAQPGDTVTLLQSVAMSSDPYAFASVVTIDKALTLDLNGNNISHTGDKYSCAITVNTPNASDVVIIKNGTVSSESGTGTNFAVVMVETGAVTLEGVTVTNVRSDAYGSNAVRTVSTGSVTLTDCTVTGYLSGTGSIKIQSGTYKSIIAGNNSLGTGIEVSGGTFHYEVTMEDCAVGYKPKDNGDGTWTVEANPFLSTLTINDIDDLKVFRDMVNAGNDFSGKTITLAASIDLSNEDWTPIGTSANKFKGTFDGGNNTISNLYVSQSDNAGLFGYIEYATIKNLTVDNVNIPAAGTGVGAVVGRSINGVKLENVKVTGTVKITGLNYVGGIIGYGWSNYAYTNCSVDAADGSYVKGATPGEGVESNYTSYVGGLVGYGGPGGKITGCSVNNLGLSTYYDNTYTAYGIGGLNGMAQTGVVIDGCSVTNVTIDAAEITATGTVVGSNNGTVADPVWLNNTTISNVTVTVREAAATADMIGTHGLNGDQMVKGCAFIGTGMQRDSNGKLIAGTFNGDVAAHVAADYQCIKNADETWSVVPVSVTVTFNSNGGSAVENQSVSYGGTATRPADPTRSGHIFLGWYLGGASYDFSTPVTGNITLVANWAIYIPAPSIPSTPVEPEWVNPFSDVADNTYYTDAVLWAVNNGITNGTSGTTFSPDAVCTRAQVVTFLWRAAGSPEPVSTVMPFTDVTANAYYYDAVLWAVENGITNGTSATTFSPDADCTRGQIVTFLWRSQGSEDASAYNPFVDVADDAYYTDAVLWAVENSVTNGTGANTFSPDADCTRAQIVTFLYRCLAQ